MKKEKEKGCCYGGGMTRRGFLTTMGVGAVSLSVPDKVFARPSQEDLGDEVLEANQLAEISLRVNHQIHRLLVEPRWSLLHVLREKIGLTGTKVGCDRGECGACTVLIDNVPRYACLVLAVEAEGAMITTLEGLMQGEELGLVQQAFVEEDAFQCGYCTPGQIMAVEGLLLQNPRPTLDDVRHGVSGNLCRCGAYEHIFKAGEKAAKLKSATRGKS